mgnify:CR=1 FL=1
MDRDAQVFIRTACMNYDTEKFYTKWLADMAADQGEDGRVGHVIPDLLSRSLPVLPGAMRLPSAVGTLSGLVETRSCYPPVQPHEEVDLLYFHPYHNRISVDRRDSLWGLAWLDAPSGSYKGSTREDFIASAFYAYSTSLVIKAGKVLGENVTPYEDLYTRIVTAFRAAYPEYRTQTECILAAHFQLAPDCQPRLTNLQLW